MVNDKLITPRPAFLIILKEPQLVAMHPGRILEPHQCHQDNDAHHPAGGARGWRAALGLWLGGGRGGVGFAWAG
jgi:hypothetical protein